MTALASGFPNLKRMWRDLEEGRPALRAVNSLVTPEEAEAGACTSGYVGFCSAVCEGGECQVSNCQSSGNCQGSGDCQGAGYCMGAACQGTNCQSGNCQGATCQGSGNIYIGCNGSIQACWCQGNHSVCGVHIEEALRKLREQGILKPAPQLQVVTLKDLGVGRPISGSTQRNLILNKIAGLERQAK
jgi:hypothetical protein